MSAEQLRKAFESWYDESHDDIDPAKDFRLSNGSYALPKIATAYRAFKAGYEAKGE